MPGTGSTLIMKIGRNDPCPCSSGKKYKKCCSGKTGLSFTKEDRWSALSTLKRFAQEVMGPEVREAFIDFYGPHEDQLEDLDQHWYDLSSQVFDMWLLFDHEPPTGTRIVDIFLDVDPPVSPGEREYLSRVRDTVLRLYEVEDARPGVSLTLRDLHRKTTVTVREKLGSRTLNRRQTVAARVLDRGPSGQPEIEPGFFHIPEMIAGSVFDQYLEDYDDCRQDFPDDSELDIEKQLTPYIHDAWMQCIFEPPIPRITNTDGEETLLTRIRFEIDDAERVPDHLDQCEGLDREAPDRDAWCWSGPNVKGETVSLGRIVMKGSNLTLEANSAERGERGRALLEDLCGEAIRHKFTVHEDLRNKVLEGLRGAPPGGRRREAPEDEIPRDVQETLVLDHLGRHYRSWIDEPIPALEDRTPREAAKDKNLRPRLLGLIHDLEGTYQKCLREDAPAYDPTWMWAELDLDDPWASPHPPPLAHERMDILVPGCAETCRAIADRVRQEPDFDAKATLVPADDLRDNLEIRRLLKDHQEETSDPEATQVPVGCTTNALSTFLPIMVNFELHRRKTFWVDEALVYMLSKTDPVIPGRDLRLPFPHFALVFTDRYMLSLIERWVSRDSSSYLAGQFLKSLTVYVSDDVGVAPRKLSVSFAPDSQGADPPMLLDQEIPLPDDQPVQFFLDSLTPDRVSNPEIVDAHPLRGALQIILNAILYATSAGVDPEVRAPPITDSERHERRHLETYSSDKVYHLPGPIKISRVKQLQALERVSSGRTMLHRFMVRGHWRRPPKSWTDQRTRWIEPHWKGPDMATIIEKTYKLTP